jgi:hypothetical protein
MGALPALVVRLISSLAHGTSSRGRGERRSILGQSWGVKAATESSLRRTPPEAVLRQFVNHDRSFATDLHRPVTPGAIPPHHRHSGAKSERAVRRSTPDRPCRVNSPSVIRRPQPEAPCSRARDSAPKRKAGAGGEPDQRILWISSG